MVYHMPVASRSARHLRLPRSARRAIEYSIAIGAALLSSYWIVWGKW